MTIAFLFPGQGTDIAEAVEAWRRQAPHVEHLLEIAADEVGLAPSQLTQPVALARTAVLQPVLTALTLGIHHTLRDQGLRPDVVAGHSVGELAACAAAGAIGAEDVVALASTRGTLMAREASLHGGRMIAVRGLAAEVTATVARAAKHGRLTIAAHNSAEDWVLSGELAALRAVATTLPTTPIDTEGAWHSTAMAGAGIEYRESLSAVVTGPLSVPFICNRTGAAARDAADIPELLAAQLTQPVEWARTMETLRTIGVTRLVVCGPGRSLRRFARAGIPQAEVTVLAHPDTLLRDWAATTR